MKKFFITLLMIGFWFLGAKNSPVMAGYFGFEPTSLTVKAGETFNVKIKINAGADELSSVDAYLLYDNTYLKVVSVMADSYFPTVTYDTATSGKVYLVGMVDDPATSKSGTGTLATIVFQAVTDGQASLSIDCNSSKIVKSDIDATNVMECSKNERAIVTVSSGSKDNPSPTPSVLPKTGIFENVLNLAIPGIFLIFLGAAARLLL